MVWVRALRLAARSACWRAMRALRASMRRLARSAFCASVCAGAEFAGVPTAAASGCISMQPTGQASTHRSQSVHSAAMTVCIFCAAPRMASTGQAWMHRVQPMHSASRINATFLPDALPRRISPVVACSFGIANTDSVYFTFMPGFAPASGDSRKMSCPPGPAARTMPSLTPNFILRGARLATIRVKRPTSCSGSL